MIRLVDEALREPHLFGRPMGLADADVKIGDPAVGTGTYLLGVLRRIASTVEDDQGPGGVPGAIEAAVKRLIGFEIQFGPFAVAQLRLIAEIQSLMSVKAGSGRNLPQPRLYVTDTLGDPYAAQTQFSSMLAPIGQSRKDANAIKRDEEITVVIGNPPYKEKAKGTRGLDRGRNEGLGQHRFRGGCRRQSGASVRTGSTFTICMSISGGGQHGRYSELGTRNPPVRKRKTGSASCALSPWRVF